MSRRAPEPSGSPWPPVAVAGVARWLDQLPPTFGDDGIPQRPPSPSKGPQERQWEISMTPPPSEPHRPPGRALSPSKRRRVDDNDDDGNDDHDEFPTDTGALDKTPRSSSRPQLISPLPQQQQQLNYRLPTRPPNLPPPASSATPVSTAPASSSGVSGTSLRQRRSASPVKNDFSLAALRKPVRFVALQGKAAQLPDDVRALYGRIQAISVEREGFIPLEIREDIARSVERDIIRDRWFYPSPAQGVKDDAAPLRPEAELARLVEIQADAHECIELGRSEPAWNMLVHGPLLRCALAGRRSVRSELVTTARIAPAFVPTTGGRGAGGSGGESVVQSKMVDFAMVLSLNGGKPWVSGFDLNPDSDPKDAQLAEAITDMVLAQPSNAQSVNHSTYQPLVLSPIAVNIETKIDGSSTHEGRLQLAIWTAAWHERMAGFVTAAAGRDARLGADADARPAIITLPLILVTEHRWDLFFACDRGRSVEIVGGVLIGSTESILDIYCLVAVLKEVADWIEGPYRRWISWLFLGGGVAATRDAGT